MLRVTHCVHLRGGCNALRTSAQTDILSPVCCARPCALWGGSYARNTLFRWLQCGMPQRLPPHFSLQIPVARFQERATKVGVPCIGTQNTVQNRRCISRCKSAHRPRLGKGQRKRHRTIISTGGGQLLIMKKLFIAHISAYLDRVLAVGYLCRIIIYDHPNTLLLLEQRHAR